MDEIDNSIGSYLLRHSRAGGGRNMCHNCFEHTSHVVGIWKDIEMNSWPLTG